RSYGDWSSDVCSSDLRRSVVVRPLLGEVDAGEREERHDRAVRPCGGRTDGNEDVHVRALVADRVDEAAVEAIAGDELDGGGEDEIGRAACRERGWRRG